MARCPHCGNKVKFLWPFLFSKTLDRRGNRIRHHSEVGADVLHPDQMQFTCETCKASLTLSILDIVFFYIIFGLPISFFGVSIPLLVFVIPIPTDKFLIAPIAWLAFLLIFSVGWVYFGIRFVWWEMLVMLRCNDAAAQRSKVRFYAAVIVTALAVIVCAEIYGRTVHKISVLEWMRTGEIRRLQ